jgi:hypothetical protein
MIDAVALIWVISHKAASKGERGWSVDKRTSVAVNMFGLINGQAYVQSRNRMLNKLVPKGLCPPNFQHPCNTDTIRRIAKT